MSAVPSSLPRRLLAAVLSPGRRGWHWLDSAGAARRAAWLMPLCFGLLSLRRGQDANWDLQNYHLYNPFALLHGKVGFDLAPGQWQSYFNPTLDLLYYALAMHLPGPLTAFLMGLLHGLHFPLLMAIARQLLPAAADGAPPYRQWLLLALAGCMGPAFLTGLGNTMGDNLTGLFVLGALWLLLSRWPVLVRGGGAAAGAAALAGLLLGLGTGLKLTNATYALALCLALLALEGRWLVRLQAAFSLGCGVLGGIALSAGHWYWKLWLEFGNPLFPQFNDRFLAPLAAPVGIGDTGWLPRGWMEKLLWPFIMTLQPQRVSELPLRHLLWPMLYVALMALAVAVMAAAVRGRRGAALAPRSRLLLLFALLAYLIWLNLFSIYRYLLPLELLAPLMFWLLMARLAPGAARWVGLSLALAAVVCMRAGDWGHAGQSLHAFRVQVPPVAQPRQSMVFTVQGNPPMGWLVPFFPDTLAFVSLGAGFPESAAYRDRVDAMRRSRSGPFYVMFDAPPAGAGPVPARVAATLARYGLRPDAGSCVQYAAMLGRTRLPYQLCIVTAQPG